jgi:hypothetical protein
MFALASYFLSALDKKAGLISNVSFLEISTPEKY